MSTRYDVITGRKARDGKTYWTKIGSMFPSERGGFQIVFDALPLTDAEGRCSALVVEPRDRDAAPSPAKQDYASAKNAPGKAAQLDDDIPF